MIRWRAFACAGCSLDLPRVLDSGKVLVVRFDPSHQSRDTIRTIGQLLTAAITSHVLGRPASKRHPIHLLVDEAQVFCSPAIAEILGWNRKFGLYATLATQRLDGLDIALQDAILGNVGNIWVGGSRSTTAECIARDTDIAADTIRRLPNLEFVHAVNGRTPRSHRLRYLGQRYAKRPAQWTEVKAQQAAAYYLSAKPSDRSPNQSTSKTGATFTPQSV